VRLIGTQDVRQDLKVHVFKATVATNIVHAMTVLALFTSGSDLLQIDWRLLSVATSPDFFLVRGMGAAVNALVLDFIVRQKVIEAVPVGRPSRLS